MGLEDLLTAYDSQSKAAATEEEAAAVVQGIRGQARTAAADETSEQGSTGREDEVEPDDADGPPPMTQDEIQALLQQYEDASKEAAWRKHELYIPLHGEAEPAPGPRQTADGGKQPETEGEDPGGKEADRTADDEQPDASSSESSSEAGVGEGAAAFTGDDAVWAERLLRENDLLRQQRQREQDELNEEVRRELKHIGLAFHANPEAGLGLRPVEPLADSSDSDAASSAYPPHRPSGSALSVAKTRSSRGVHATAKPGGGNAHPVFLTEAGGCDSSDGAATDGGSSETERALLEIHRRDAAGPPGGEPTTARPAGGGAAWDCRGPGGRAKKRGFSAASPAAVVTGSSSEPSLRSVAQPAAALSRRGSQPPHSPAARRSNCSGEDAGCSARRCSSSLSAPASSRSGERVSVPALGSSRHSAALREYLDKKKEKDDQKLAEQAKKLENEEAGRQARRAANSSRFHEAKRNGKARAAKKEGAMKPEAVMARNEMLARKEAERIKKEVAAQLQKASLVPAQPSPTALRADRIHAQLQKETSSRVVPTTSLPSRPSVTVKQPRPPPSASEELENLLRAAGSLPEHAEPTAKQKEQREKLLQQLQLSSALSQQVSKTLA